MDYILKQIWNLIMRNFGSLQDVQEIIEDRAALYQNVVHFCK